MTSLEAENEIMAALAAMLDDILNGEDHAAEEKRIFALLVFTPGAIGGSHANWVSNGQRPDMLKAMKEMVARFEAQDRLIHVDGKAVLQ